MTRSPFAATAAMAVLLGGITLTAAEPAAKFSVIGYLPDYRVDGFDEKICRQLDELVFFSIEPRADGTLDTGRLKPGMIRQLGLLRKKYRLKLRICVGGWDRSRGFIACTAKDASRARLVEQLVAFCRTNGFDGVDLDWEHPKGPAQQAAYTRLIVETRKAFTPRQLSLTAAIAGWQQLPPAAWQSLDRIHLMSYDAAGRHSTLAQARQDIDRLRKAGIPANRICLGVPFYGRSLDKKRTAYTYADIVRRFSPKPTTDQTNGIYFNGPATIRRKTRLAISGGLAGISIWEIGQDLRGPGSLLSIIAGSVKRPSERP